jgi:excinuclease UvrABC nuclease subunit
MDLGSRFGGRVTLAAEPWGKLFPEAPGVYAVVLGQEFPRLFGETDILYIGRAGKLVNRGGRQVQASLRQRWTDYWQGTVETEQDFRDTLRLMMSAGDAPQVLFTTHPITPEALAELEAELLGRFFADHRELPPLNRAKPR